MATAATCPTQITFEGTSTNGVLDTGWTGQGHDATVISEGQVTVSVTTCAGTAPNCGVCAYVGPIDNAAGELDSSRCSNDSSIHCAPGNNLPCGAGTCKFFFGSYLPLAAGGVSTCVENTFNGGISGTANVDNGTSAGVANVTARVFSGPTLSQPCPQCVGDGTANDGVAGGTCSAGLHAGAACDRSGSSPNAAFGPTSLDCPPLTGGVIGTLPIDLSNTTGTKTRTLSAANPSCRAIGFTTLKCQCDTCNNAAATPCSSNADCTAVGATICGGKRCLGGANNGAPCAVNSECPGVACGVPGAATAPNQCDDGVCSPDPGTPSPNDGICNGGPFEQFCSPTETFRGCTSNVDCGFAGDTCSLGKNRDCFDSGGIGETVVATGNPDPPVGHQSDPTLAALFCIGPTTSAAVNSATGLPGLGRLELQGHSVDNGTGGPTAIPTPTPTSATPAGTATPIATSTPERVIHPTCDRAILEKSAKFATAQMKALTKCEEAKVKGKMPIGTVCVDDPKTGATIAKAESKLRVAIAKGCGGSDKICGTPDDDTPGSLGWPSTCPDFEGKGCTNAIEHCGDIAECLVCVNTLAVAQAVNLYYASLISPVSNKPLNTCQVAIGKKASKFLAAQSKALSKCEKGVIKGTVTDPCPDAVAAAPAIAKAESKEIAGICKACGGADKLCGGGDDFTPAQIGFVAECPSVTIPDGAACGGPIATLQDIVTCVGCVTKFKVDCLHKLWVPWLPYPSVCSPAAIPYARSPYVEDLATHKPAAFREAAPEYDGHFISEDHPAMYLQHAGNYGDRPGCPSCLVNDGNAGAGFCNASGGGCTSVAVPSEENLCCLVVDSNGQCIDNSPTPDCLQDPYGNVTQAGIDEAKTYYGQISKGLKLSAGDPPYAGSSDSGPQNLNEWQTVFGFGNTPAGDCRKPGTGESVLAWGDRCGCVWYFNDMELALGRFLCCAEFDDRNDDATPAGRGLACMVGNFGKDFDQLKGGLKGALEFKDNQNTVCVTTRPSRPAHFRTQWWAFGGVTLSQATNGAWSYGPPASSGCLNCPGPRLNKVGLDRARERPIPLSCANCHGGVYAANDSCERETTVQITGPGDVAHVRGDADCGQVKNNCSDKVNGGACTEKHMIADSKFLPLNPWTIKFADDPVVNLPGLQPAQTRGGQLVNVQYINSLAFNWPVDPVNYPGTDALGHDNFTGGPGDQSHS